MKFLGDYHTHTVYSDAVNTVEDVAQCAIRQGLKQVAITDHGFLNKWMSLTPRKFEKEIVEVVEVQKRFPQIDILQ
ncbi:MAG: PHP domain-containing protein, partial [Clostridia bacterium]